MPTLEGRHTLCLQFERFLDALLADQATGNSYAFRVLSAEFGITTTDAIMKAADLRKAQRDNPRREP